MAKKDVTAPQLKVTEGGPYLVSGRIPLIHKVIVSDNEETATAWRDVKTFPLKDTMALCRCGQSRNKPFCDGTHSKVKFKGVETADEAYLREPKKYRGRGMTLSDHEPLCASARFCHRAGGIWNLIKKTDDPTIRQTVIEEVADCPSGRLVIMDMKNKEFIEPLLEKSIVAIEDPVGGGLGPLWIRGEIPVISSTGKTYAIRNRITLCRCGKSQNKPFCDSSHYPEEHQSE